MGDLLGGPAAVTQHHRLLVGMGPQCEAVSADADGLAGHTAGGVGGEEGDEPGDIVDRAESFVLAHPVRQGRTGTFSLFDGGREDRNGLGHLGGSDRDDGVYGDLGPGQFHGPRARHGHDARLGRRIVGLSEVPALPRRRADQNDASALTLLTHPHSCCSGTGEGAAHMNTHDVVEVVVGHLPQHPVAQDAGIGDEDVQPPEMLHRRGDQLFGRTGVTDGSRHTDRLAMRPLPRP